MLKGTRVLTGVDAYRYRQMLQTLRDFAISAGYSEVVVPSIWEAETFQKKIQGETLGQMWQFKDKGNRDCCLIPEVTGIIQEIYNDSWEKTIPKPIKIFYEARAYRYEKPQAGRYREFTQFGVEILGGDKEANQAAAIEFLTYVLEYYGIDYKLNPKVTRGLGYYTDDGFEVECASLGAQKQIAGGGKYAEGVGFAIGIERLLMAYGDRGVSG